MRLRTLKPGFFENDELAALPALTRLLFAGLWCYADRQGRFEWRLARIKAAVLPYESTTLDVPMNDLVRAGFVRRYEVVDHAYGEVVAFTKHQRPHKNEQPSQLPPPQPLGDGTTKVVPEHNQGDCMDAQSLGSGVLGLGSGITTSVGPDGPAAAEPQAVENGHSRNGHSKPPRVADPEAAEIAAGMATLIARYDPERSASRLRRVTSAASVEEIRRLIQVDHRQPQDVRDVLVWLFRNEPGDYQGTGDFDWRTVIQGGQSLRKSWDQIAHRFRAAVRED